MATADVKRESASWYMAWRVKGIFSNRRMMDWRPPSLRLAITPASASTVHRSVTTSATQPMPMETATALNEPVVRPPARLS